MWVRAFLTILAVAGLLVASPAGGKGGVRAKLDRPVRLDTAPGKRITVAWHLFDRDDHAFMASGIYLRVSRCGRKPLRLAATDRGDGYFVRMTVPNGGVRKLMVGLKGWRIYRGRRERADAYFQFDPPLYRDCR